MIYTPLINTLIHSYFPAKKTENNTAHKGTGGFSNPIGKKGVTPRVDSPNKWRTYFENMVPVHWYQQKSTYLLIEILMRQESKERKEATLGWSACPPSWYTVLASRSSSRLERVLSPVWSIPQKGVFFLLFICIGKSWVNCPPFIVDLKVVPGPWFVSQIFDLPQNLRGKQIL